MNLPIISAVLLAAAQQPGVEIVDSPGADESESAGPIPFTLLVRAPLDPLDTSPILILGDEAAAGGWAESIIALERRWFIPNRRRPPHAALERRLVEVADPETGLVLLFGEETRPPAGYTGVVARLSSPPAYDWRLFHPGAGDLRLDTGSLAATSWQARSRVFTDGVAPWAEGFRLAESGRVPPGLVYRDGDGASRRVPGLDPQLETTSPPAWRSSPELQTAQPPGLRFSFTEGGGVLRCDAPITAVATTPGAVFFTLGGSPPRLCKLGAGPSAAWSLELPAPAVKLHPLGPGLIALVDEAGGVYVVDDAGKMGWSGTFPGETPPICAVFEQQGAPLLLCLADGAMAVVDPAEKTQAPPVRLPTRVTSSPVVLGERVYYGAGCAVQAVDINGGSRWKHHLGGALQLQPRVSGGLIFCAAGDHRLYVFDPSRPTAPLVEVHELGAPPAALYPLPNGSVAVATLDGRLLFHRPGGLETTLELGAVPRPGGLTRGDELILPLGAGELAAINLEGTPFAGEKTGFNEPSPAWRRAFDAVVFPPSLFQPRSDSAAAASRIGDRALYVVDGDGALWIIHRGDPVE